MLTDQFNETGRKRILVFFGESSSLGFLAISPAVALEERGKGLTSGRSGIRFVFSGRSKVGSKENTNSNTK